MSVRIVRHALCFCCVAALAVLAVTGEAQSMARPKIQVKVLDEALAIEVPSDLDQNVFIEAKYVAVVKGFGVFGNRAHIRLVMSHAQDELGSFLDKEYGRTVLHYVNGQLYSRPGRFQRGPMPGLMMPPGAYPMGSPMIPGEIAPSRPTKGKVARSGTSPAPYPPSPATRSVRPRPISPGVSRIRSPAGWHPALGPLQAQPQKTDSPGPLVHEFRILAETPERAEELARALIAAYDSYVQSTRAETQVALKEQETHLLKLQATLRTAQEEYEQISQQLSGLEPIPQQVYEELKTKEWTLRVEMAGVEGRLKAARKLTSSGRGGGRADSRTTVERDKVITQVAEQISITSEIELAGLLEQLSKIEEFLKMYKNYSQLKAQQKPASAALSRAKNDKAGTERLIESLKKGLEEELLPFELIEPIQIRPIEWTKGSRSR